MISDEELQEMIETEGRDYAEPEQLIETMATELLQYREEKRQAEEARAKSWEGAPEWAQWRAQDADGLWWVYEEKPIKYAAFWDRHKGRTMETEQIGSTWEDTLEERP